MHEHTRVQIARETIKNDNDCWELFLLEHSICSDGEAVYITWDSVELYSNAVASDYFSELTIRDFHQKDLHQRFFDLKKAALRIVDNCIANDDIFECLSCCPTNAPHFPEFHFELQPDSQTLMLSCGMPFVSYKSFGNSALMKYKAEWLQSLILCNRQPDGIKPINVYCTVTQPAKQIKVIFSNINYVRYLSSRC